MYQKVDTNLNFVDREKKVEECKKLADKVGIKLRVRKYIDEH